MDFKIENKIIKLQPRSNKLPIPGRVSQKSERLWNPGDELDEPRHFGTEISIRFQGLQEQIEINVSHLRGKGLRQLDQGSKRDLRVSAPAKWRFKLGSFIVHSDIYRVNIRVN